MRLPLVERWYYPIVVRATSHGMKAPVFTQDSVCVQCCMPPIFLYLYTYINQSLESTSRQSLKIFRARGEILYLWITFTKPKREHGLGKNSLWFLCRGPLLSNAHESRKQYTHTPGFMKWYCHCSWAKTHIKFATCASVSVSLRAFSSTHYTLLFPVFV